MHQTGWFNLPFSSALNKFQGEELICNWRYKRKYQVYYLSRLNLYIPLLEHTWYLYKLQENGNCTVYWDTEVYHLSWDQMWLIHPDTSYDLLEMMTWCFWHAAIESYHRCTHICPLYFIPKPFSYHNWEKGMQMYSRYHFTCLTHELHFLALRLSVG